MKIFNFSVCIFGLLFLILSFLVGCAEIKPPAPEEVIRRPFGRGPLRIGMTKEKVKSLWGEPDIVKVLGTDEQAMVKEEWIYRGRYPNLPLDALDVGYLKTTQHLFFDGNNLVNFSQQE